MLSNLFSSRKNVLEKLQTSNWADQAEKDALCAELRKSAAGREVIPLLVHIDTAVRSAAAEVFFAAPDEKTASALIEFAADKQPAVRASLMRLVGRLPEALQLGACNALIGDKNPNRVKLGWEVALVLTGPQRFPVLERALKEGPPTVRQTALQRLVAERPLSSQLDFLLATARDEDPRVALIAFEAITGSEDARVLGVMLDFFASSDPVIRQRAATWLSRAAAKDPALVRKRMLEVLGSGEDSVRAHCVTVLLATGSAQEVVGQILDFSRSLAGWLRTRIIESLKGAGEPVVVAAVGLLDHPDEEIRTSALALCEHLEDPRVVEPVARLLSDSDWWMRISTCDTLGRLKDERAVPHLVQALEDRDTRWAAIDALAQIASPKAVRPLVNLLRDPRVEVRLAVVRALSRFPDERLLPVLVQIREKDPSSEVRTRASEIIRDFEQKLGKVGAAAVEAGTHAVSAASLARPLDRLLAQVREQGFSDVHVTVGEPPFARRNGQLVRMEGLAPIDEAQSRELILGILDERQRATLESTGELDFCHAIPEVGRYRANAYVQRKGMCANFRVIPNVPPTFADLGIPPQLAELLDYHQGIIVVSGPAGSGKSTTLSAIVNLINETKADHVLTLEDPIEFAHPVKTALINQREVGRHTQSFSRALRAALREDPDVIVVGEMRDVDTIRLALSAAETGHLVVGTLHTTGAVATIERLVKAFPPEEQSQVRMALSESLKYVLSQSLLPRLDGQGRVAVFEVLKGTPSIGNLIRDNKTFQIPSMMQIGRKLGMMTREMAIDDLVKKGILSEHYLHGGKPEEAAPAAPAPTAP